MIERTIRIKNKFQNTFLLLKDLNSTVAKRGPVFIGLMTSDYMVQGCLNEVIIISLQEVIKRSLKANLPVI